MDATTRCTDPLAVRQPAPSKLAASSQPKPGDALGHYRIDELCGAGGMGSVYRAWDCALERPAAIKLLHASIGWSENSDLQREAYALSRLQHPNIATFFEAGEVRGQLSGRRRPRRRRFGQGSDLRERTTASRRRAAWSSVAISH